MAKSFSRNKPAFEEPSINLTPLIDVVFVILIGFIIIAPLLEVDQIELAKASHQAITQVPAQEKHLIAIQVRKDNTIWLGERQIPELKLLELLQEAKKHHPNAIPQLFHDKKGYFGTYQVVKNALEDAGFEKVDVILDPN